MFYLYHVTCVYFFSLKTLGHLCLHIEAIKKAKDDKSEVLPQYNCLLLSPANLWNQDVQQFSQDNGILSTIYSHHVGQNAFLLIEALSI